MSKMSTFIFLFFLFLLNPFNVNAQGCESTIDVHLKSNVDSNFANVEVKLISKLDSAIFLQTTNVMGIAKFTVPCDLIFKLIVSNRDDEFEVLSPSQGGGLIQTLTYQSQLIQEEKTIEMNEEEIAMVDYEATLVADTVYTENSKMPTPTNLEAYVEYNFTINNNDGKPLVGENIVITGTKRNKSVKGVTDENGKISVYLLKGDVYTINFKYHVNFASEECKYTRGYRVVNVTFTYSGTMAIERGMTGVGTGICTGVTSFGTTYGTSFTPTGSTFGDAYISRYTSGSYSTFDTVVPTVLNRNVWENKLIVCDLTGSMEPYSAQLALWYKINLEKEQDLQFVFFNDGNNIFDSQKTIGATGGIYYSDLKGLGSLATLMASVRAHGDGGDPAENNMEALIEGVKMAKPFEEIVMIADNYAPVKDLNLVYDFNHPVHIILCGAVEGWVHPDYLFIAWKTKGSIHTIEEDINEIGTMINGQEIEIGGISYRLQNGEFVQVNSLTAR